MHSIILMLEIVSDGEVAKTQFLVWSPVAVLPIFNSFENMTKQITITLILFIRLLIMSQFALIIFNIKR